MVNVYLWGWIRLWLNSFKLKLENENRYFMVNVYLGGWIGLWMLKT